MGRMNDEEYIEYTENEILETFNRYKKDDYGNIPKIMCLKNIEIKAGILMERLKEKLSPEELKELNEIERNQKRLNLK